MRRRDHPGLRGSATPGPPGGCAPVGAHQPVRAPAAEAVDLRGAEIAGGQHVVGRRDPRAATNTGPPFRRRSPPGEARPAPRVRRARRPTTRRASIFGQTKSPPCSSDAAVNGRSPVTNGLIGPGERYDSVRWSTQRDAMSRSDRSEESRGGRAPAAPAQAVRGRGRAERDRVAGVHADAERRAARAEDRAQGRLASRAAKRSRRTWSSAPRKPERPPPVAGHSVRSRLTRTTASRRRSWTRTSLARRAAGVVGDLTDPHPVRADPENPASEGPPSGRHHGHDVAGPDPSKLVRETPRRDAGGDDLRGLAQLLGRGLGAQLGQLFRDGVEGIDRIGLIVHLRGLPSLETAERTRSV